MRKGLMSVMMANIFCLVVSLIINFILPKYLSVESYAQMKVYTLYISYAGFFSLGYNDGMYLKYGGKRLSDIDSSDIGSNIKNYFFLEILMLLIVLNAGMLLHNNILVAFSFGMLVNNVLGYLKSLYQATGEFTKYSYALNIEKISVFFANIILLFVLKTDNYYYFIWIQIFVGFVIVAFLTGKIYKSYNVLEQGQISFNEIKENVSTGFILMLGNFSSTLFTGLDRWFVKILMGTVNFAYYSFAVSVESLINTFLTPITISMYNYFCQNRNDEKIKEIKNIVLIWGFIVIAAAYPAKWILENYIPNYIEANSVIFLLFSAQVFYVVIKGIYVNLYKAEKSQNKYLKQMVIMIIIAFILNAFFYYIFKSKEAIATATLITSIIWLSVCEFEYKTLRFGFNELLAIFLMMVCYFLTGYTLSAFRGLIIYCITGLIVCTLFMRKDFFSLIKMILSFINKNRENS